MKRLVAAGIPITLLVSACAPVRDLASGSGSNEAVEVSAVKLATEEPGPGYERLQRVRGYSESECGSVRLAEARAAAQADLRRRAAQEGAEYVRVIGSGPLSERGQCTNDFYRVSGMAYASQDTRDDASASAGGDAGSDAAADADEDAPEAAPSQRERAVGDADSEKSPADKLADLEEMRERGLISESEYERLRRQIIEEAF